jgi:uncharacterized repeat protein (TIGR02543 family)
MDLKKLLATFAFALVILLTGCAKDEVVEIVGVCPIVLSTVPDTDAINVPLDQVITVTFNEEVDPETINEDTFTIDGATSVVGTVTSSGATATFTPSADLAPNTTYTGMVTTSVKDPMGNALQENYVWTFTTIPEVTLSATPEAGGTLIGAGTYADGSSVTVAAIPNDGFTFTNWTVGEAVVSTSSSYQFEMDGNIELMANFTAVTAGNFTVNLSSLPIAGGTTNGSGQYSANSTVTVAALPNPGYVFDNWTEGETIASTSSSYQFVLTGNRTLVANYSLILENQFAVILSANPAAGGSTNGSGSFDADANVTVTATPNNGYAFVNWTANEEEVSTNSSYTFAITANTNLVANFEVRTYTLNVTAENGTVVKNPNEENYNSGVDVVLTPTPATGYEFSSWSGDATGSNNPLTVTMNDDKNITANFTAIVNTFTLNVTAENGTVEKNPNQQNFNDGDDVVLTATPANGYEFSTWSGDATGSNNPLTVTMNDDKNITANFTEISSGFSLNVTAQNGSVEKNPDNLTYNDGDNVTLTPTPDSGYEFTSWSDDATGSNNPLTVLMNSNKNITANFTLIGSAKGPGIIDLGTAGDFVILSKSGIDRIGVTSIIGNIGVSPIGQTALTGFSQSMDVSNTFSTSDYVTGKLYAADYTAPTPAYLTTAISDMETALTTANGLTTDVIVALGAGDISGMTLAPGLYKWDTGLLITNAGVTLSGGPDDTWVFQISKDFTIDNDAKITLAGGAQAKNIFWVTKTQAVLGSNVQFQGNIIAETLISVNTGTTVLGRLLSQTAVTLNTNIVTKP